MPLLCAIVVACIVGVAYGHSFKSMLQGMLDRLMTSMEAILILLLVGLLISSFMAIGTGLSRNMLSRTLEDAGTMWSPLFPWTPCGAYQMSVLGLSPLVYFPFAFVNVLSPIYSYVTAASGRNIFWADGAYTNLLGKTKKGKPAACPDDVREVALANLEAAREQGRAPRPQD